MAALTLQIVFGLFATGSVVFGANVVLRKNPALCAVHLVGCFFCLAGIYLLIGFPFLAALQLMVYAGAIMVLFLFVIMLLDIRSEKDGDTGDETPYATLLAPLLAGGILGLVATVYPDSAIAAAPVGSALPDEAAAAGGKGLAVALFGKHLLAFEAASLLLLAGIIGVVVLAKRRRAPADEPVDVEPARAQEPAEHDVVEEVGVGGRA